MNLPENYAYYLGIVTVTFVFSFLLAIKAMLSKSKLTFQLKIKDKFIWVPIIIYFIVFSFLAILKYNAYNMGMLDLGRMDQVIWNTAHGRFFACTLELGNTCRLIAHCEFIYLLLAPFYLVYPNPKTLLVIQTLVISLGALPIYWLAKKRLDGNFTPLCFALAYLLYPSLQYGNLLDFHSDMLATTFLLFTFYYLERKSWFKYFAFLLLSLSCKEYVSFILVMLGIYILFKQRNIKISCITILLGVFWFFLTYKVIPPFFIGKRENITIKLYAHLGTSISQVIKNIIFHPVSAISGYMCLGKLANFIFLFLPLGFISLLNPLELVIASPIFIGVILSPLFSYANHHNGTVIPFIFISAIGAGQYLINKFDSKFINIAPAIGIFVFSASLLSNVFYGPSPLSWRFWGKSSYRYFGHAHQFKETEHDKVANKIIKMIPQEARVSASNHLAAHLSQRETIYHFPFPKNFNNIDFIIVDLLEYFAYDWIPRKEEIKTLRDLLSGKDFSLVFYEDGILLLQRGHKKENDYYLNAVKVKQASPQYSVNLTFNERLLLMGYDLKDDYFEAGKKQRIVYYWQVLKDFDRKFLFSSFSSTENLNKEYILIDTFENKGIKIRLLHLPTYLLYTPADWKVGDIIREEFDFYVPKNISLGNYVWKIGLYMVPNYFFIKTDAQNLVAGTLPITIGQVILR